MAQVGTPLNSHQRTNVYALLMIAAALSALDGTYLTVESPPGDLSRWYVAGVTRRPDAPWVNGPLLTNIIERLVSGLNAAAERESDPERKSRIKSAAVALADSPRDVAAEVLAKVIERHTGLG